MDKRLEIAQAKELRGKIVNTLYDFLGEDVTLNTIRNLLKYQKYYSDKDIKRAVYYLSGANKKYIHIEANTEEYWDSQVQLTPAGVNLAEGDVKDMGVMIDE